MSYVTYVHLRFLFLYRWLKTTPKLLNVIRLETSFDRNMFQYSNTPGGWGRYDYILKDSTKYQHCLVQRKCHSLSSSFE